MSILSVCQDLSPVIGIGRPDVVFGSDDEDAVRLAALANEMGERIARAAEWQMLLKLRTITGDGSDTTFGLPTDFDRFPQSGELRSSMWAGARLQHISDPDEWLQRTLLALTAGPPAWTIIGDTVNFDPAPASGELVKFYYLSNQWAKSAGGDNQASFLVDSDSFRLNERTLRLAMIAQWKANMGLDAAIHAGVADKALAEDIARDRGPRAIRIGTPTVPRDVTLAWPGVLG